VTGATLLIIPSLLVVVMPLAIARLLAPDVLMIKHIFLAMVIRLNWKECIVHFVKLTLAVVSRSGRAERRDSCATSQMCGKLLWSNETAGVHLIIASWYICFQCSTEHMGLNSFACRKAVGGGVIRS
jgi:hypothetical protein